MSIDILSNMLSTIKNATMVQKPYVEVIHSKECESVAKVLSEQNFVGDVKTFKEKGESYKRLRINLKYDENGKSRITKLRRVSTPGNRVYKGANDLHKVRNGFGILIVSTNRGIVEGSYARNKRLGGEVLCEVY